MPREDRDMGHLEWNMQFFRVWRRRAGGKGVLIQYTACFREI